MLCTGVCSFAEKAAHAEAAGAVVAIIYDNDEENSQHYVDMVKEDYVRNLVYNHEAPLLLILLCLYTSVRWRHTLSVFV